MENWSTADEATALLRQLFPGSLVCRGVLEALCPHGWERSPLRTAFHPPPEMLYDELLKMRENLRAVFGHSRRNDPPPDDPPQSLEDFLDDFTLPDSVPAAEEVGRLTGLCLWDVFSDNHDVLLPDGRAARLGSFRGTADELAAFFYGRHEPATDGAADFMSMNMDYMEFYMGTRLIAHRASLQPVYHLIFARLREAGCDWRYSFPRLSLGRPGQIKAGENSRPEWETYDPSAAFAAEEEQHEKEEELSRIAGSRETAYRESIAAARDRPPPETVQAYREVYGHWPDGWPPWEE